MTDGREESLFKTALSKIGLKKKKVQLKKKLISFEDFLNDDKFWESHKDGSDIPTDFFKKDAEPPFKYDPRNKVVGHDREKKRVEDALLDYIEEEKKRETLEKVYKEMGLPEDAAGKACVVDKLKEELPCAEPIFFYGPYGSSKSLQQKCYQELFFMMRDEEGAMGHEFLAEWDKTKPYGMDLRTCFGGEGIKRVEDYEKWEKRKNKLKRVGKWAAIGGTLGLASVWFVNVLERYGPMLYTRYVEQQGDWVKFFKQLFGLIELMVWVDIDEYSNLAYIALGTTALGVITKYLRRHEIKTPHLLADARTIPPVLLGHETKEDLIGKYLDVEGYAPQFRITEPLLLKTDSKPLIIENLSNLKEDVQLILAQTMEEREVEVAGKFRRFVRPLFFIGANTDKLPGVVSPLKSRITYGVVEEVTNEIERSVKNDRHLKAFLAYLCKRYGTMYADPEGENKYLELSSKLADDVNQLHISRRTVAIPRYAGRFAKEDGSTHITPKHMDQAEKCVKSIVQQVLDRKLRHYIDRTNIETKGERVGKVNVIAVAEESNLEFTGSLEDRRLFDDYGEKEVYVGAQSEDHIGYVATMAAFVYPVDDFRKAKFEIIDKKGNLKRIDFYKSQIETLLRNDGIDISNDIIMLDARLYNDDDAIVTGGYLAIRSAIKGEKLRQDVAVATGLSPEGITTPLDKLNARLYGVDGSIGSVVVTGHDYNNRVKKEWYPDLEINTADKKEDILKKIVVK